MRLYSLSGLRGDDAKQISISVIMLDIKSKRMLYLFQENKSYGIKTTALILCLHVALHHIPNRSIANFCILPQKNVHKILWVEIIPQKYLGGGILR